MKATLAFILLSIIAISGCVTGQTTADPNQASSYELDQSLLPAGWTLIGEKPNLAAFEQDMRRDFIKQGVIDAAAREYEFADQGTQTGFLNVIVRIYESKEVLEAAEGPFRSPLAWEGKIKQLQVGDKGVAGVYKQREGNDPFMLYTTKGNVMLYLVYFNDIGKYDDFDRHGDTAFLLKFARDIFDEERTDDYYENLETPEPAEETTAENDQNA